MSNDDYSMQEMAAALDRDEAAEAAGGVVGGLVAMAEALDRDHAEAEAAAGHGRAMYIQIVGDGDPPFGAGHMPPAALGPDWHGLDNEALTAAHCAIETELCALRDARISVTGPANGFVVRERDGSDSPIMRLGTRDGAAVGIAAYLDCIMAKAMDGWPGLGEYLKAKGWIE